MLARNRFCDNWSDEGVPALLIENGVQTDSVVQNNVFAANGSGDGSGTMSAFFLDDYAGSGELSFVNNTMVGNTTLSMVSLNDGPVDVRNNIFMGTGKETAVWGYDTSDITGGYNLFHQLGSELLRGIDGNECVDHAQYGDPLFEWWDHAPPAAPICTRARARRPSTTATPEIFDEDGSVSDIGAFGGPSSTDDPDPGDDPGDDNPEDELRPEPYTWLIGGGGCATVPAPLGLWLVLLPLLGLRRR